MKISNVLFVDIETVSAKEKLEHLPEDWKELWKLKMRGILEQDDKETLESSYSRAGLYAEFGKIICISCGYLVRDKEGRLKMETRSFHDKDERKLLQAFATLLKNWKCTDGMLCAHNGKEFDFPFIARRMIINGVLVPAILNTKGKKPWEIRHIDTLELWKFSDFKYRTSLNLMAKALNVPSSKDDIDGSQVHEVYWVQKDLKRIVRYCVKDIRTLAMVYCKLEQLFIEEPGEEEPQLAEGVEVSDYSDASLPFLLQAAA